MTTHIIDPPDAFAPLAEWVRFRKEMEALHRADPHDVSVAEALEQAQEGEARAREGEANARA